MCAPCTQKTHWRIHTDTSGACKRDAPHTGTHMQKHILQAEQQLNGINLKKVLIEALITRNKLIQLWQGEKWGVWKWQWRTIRVERSSLLQECMRIQSGLSIVLPPLRPVKTHRPPNKRPLTTTGGFSFQWRLRTATHFQSTKQTPDPFVLNASHVTQHPAPDGFQPLDTELARKPDPWQCWFTVLLLGFN